MLARTLFLARFLSIASLVGGPWQAADALDFRVDTEVFFGTEKQPVEALTIFTEGKIYDFLLTEPREITVFDPVGGRITLLNESQQVQAKISTQDLMAFTFELETQASQNKNTLLAFAARPEFEKAFEDVMENGQPMVRVKLSAKPMEYVALGQKPQQEDAARSYLYFADWYARLNATRTLNLPAGARLELNKALGERNLLPVEITRIIYPPTRLERKLEVKSRHLVNWTLSGKDQKEIERVGECMATFRTISYDEYRAPPGKPLAGKPTLNKQANKQVKK